MSKSQFHSCCRSPLFTWAIPLGSVKRPPAWLSLVTVGVNQLTHCPSSHPAEELPTKTSLPSTSEHKKSRWKLSMLQLKETQVFQADGIDLKFYHFLCHKSPRLWWQCQHFSLYALLKCFTLIGWGRVIFFLLWRNLKDGSFLSHSRLPFVMMLIWSLWMTWVWNQLTQTKHGSKVGDVINDVPAQHPAAVNGIS